MDSEKIFINKIKELLYDKTKEEVINMIPQINEQELLYMYIYNYNWDNGFEIPKMIVESDKCCLSLALLIFYRADGFSYLMDKTDNKKLEEWYEFISSLYYLILSGKYNAQKIKFKIPLSKVQLYKVRKTLGEGEEIFIDDIEGKDFDITL